MKIHINDFIQRSEPKILFNLALLLEKTLDDKIILSSIEKKELEEIIKKIDEIEQDIINLGKD